MAISKTLLLKGLGGVAAAGTVTVGGLGVAYPKEFGNLFKSQKQIDKSNKEKIIEAVNKTMDSLGLDGCHLSMNDFARLEEYSKNCTLDESKFKKIKFSNSGDNGVDVKGWTNGNTITLNISNGSDGGIKFLLKDHPSSLTITGTNGEQNNKITIKTNRETEFKEEGGRLVKVVDSKLKEKLEGVNGKLRTLSLPSDCRFDSTEKDKSLECSLDEAQLKAINFSNKAEGGNLTVRRNVAGLKVKVEVEDDASFYFTGLTQDITILGDNTKGKIVLKSSGDRTFKEKDGKLEKVSRNDATITSKLRDFNGKTPQILKLPDGCRFDEAEDNVSTECILSESDLKKIMFSNRGTTDVTLEDSFSGTIKLKIERKGEDFGFYFKDVPQNTPITILGDSSKGKIVLKSTPERTFKVVGEKLEKVSQNDAAKTNKLKTINTTLKNLNLPNFCRFDEREPDISIECQLTLDQFKNLKLTSRGDNEDLTVSSEAGYNGFTKAKLKVEYINNRSNPIFTISDLDKKIKFGKAGEEIVLETGNSYRFEVRNGKLGPKRLLNNPRNRIVTDPGFSTCSYDGNSNKGSCKTSSFVEMLFQGGAHQESIVLKNNSDKFLFWEYQEGYNETIKFIFQGTTSCSGGNKSRKVENGKEYEFKKKGNDWRLIEKPSSR